MLHIFKVQSDADQYRDAELTPVVGFNWQHFMHGYMTVQI